MRFFNMCINCLVNILSLVFSKGPKFSTVLEIREGLVTHHILDIQCKWILNIF